MSWNDDPFQNWSHDDQINAEELDRKAQKEQWADEEAEAEEALKRDEREGLLY